MRDGKLNIKVTSGPYELLASGVVVVEGLKPVRFTIDDIYIELKFLDDELEMRMETEISGDGRGILMRMYNANNPLGSGYHDIRPLGTVDGYQILFSFSAYKRDHSEKKLRGVEYSFYKGEKASV